MTSPKKTEGAPHRLTLRPAKEEDCKLLWHWRNDKETRKWSFNTDLIPYEEHKKWFLNKLNTSDSLILIISDGKNDIGQVRFDMNQDGSAEVNIGISAAERQKGYGAEALKLACRYVQRKFKVTKVIAHIKEGNEASIKAFTDAGFTSKGRREFKGHRVIEMSWDNV